MSFFVRACILYAIIVLVITGCALYVNFNRNVKEVKNGLVSCKELQQTQKIQKTPF